MRLIVIKYLNRAPKYTYIEGILTAFYYKRQILQISVKLESVYIFIFINHVFLFYWYFFN